MRNLDNIERAINYVGSTQFDTMFGSDLIRYDNEMDRFSDKYHKTLAGAVEHLDKLFDLGSESDGALDVHINDLIESTLGLGDFAD